MGFLNASGEVLTYNEYKQLIAAYKERGLSQFLQLYLAHKDRFIPIDKLHWGEEIEYSLYCFNRDEKIV